MGTVNIIESPSPSAIFIEHFIECIDSLPDDIQRNVSQLRELDLLYRGKLSQISNLLDLYNGTEDQTTMQRYLTKIQRCLVKSQEYGDEKLQLISQIVEVADNRNMQMSKDADNLDAPIRRESSPMIIKQDHGVNYEEPRGSSERHQSKRPRRQKTISERFVDIQERPMKAEKIPKVEKVAKVEKTTKNEKKAIKAEKLDINESDLANATASAEAASKKSADTKKERETTTGKKKTGKQKDTKKKNGNIKKKKKKEVADIPIDPDEPTYCSCNQVSYGEMIGCDNEECPIEWFHFSCVNLTTKPKGKWYCPQCTIERREKGKK